MRKRKEDKMILISVHVPQKTLERLDELVRDGVFANRSEAIRHALRELLLYYTEVKVERKPQEHQKKVDPEEEEMAKALLEGRQ